MSERGLARGAYVMAALLLLGEAGRILGPGSYRAWPLALDEVAVAGALVAAGIASRRAGAAPLAAGWALFSGMVLALLIDNADYIVAGRAKANAWVYVAALSALLAIGAAATVRALTLAARR